MPKTGPDARGSAVPHEIELKLAVPKDKLARLRRNPLLRSLARARSATKRLRSIYFDTPDLKLQRHGMALRIRHDGARRIQTLKLPVAGAGGLHNHREFDAEVAGEHPDLSLVEDVGLREFFQANEIGGDLVPVFETDFDRKIVPLRMVDSEIELAIDVGEIRSGAHRMPLCEAELELQSGRAGRLFELALALHGMLPVLIETRTKAARGYGLYIESAPAPERAQPVELDGGMRVRDAIAAVVRNCLRQIRNNGPCVERGEDPEGVHQMRVGVRRLRAALAAFRELLAPDVHHYLAGELRWLQTQLGPARDWDVFIAETLQPLRRRLPDDLALEAMWREAESLRRDGYVTARAALSDPRYTELVLRLELLLESGGWSPSMPPERTMLDEPVAALAAPLLQRRHRRMRKLGGKHGDLPEPDLHELRLRGKKLRYLAEFFRTLYAPKPARRYLAALSEIQEALGSLNDALVSRQLLSELEGRLGASAPALGTRGVGIVLGWQAARIEQDLGRFRGVWESFLAQKPFWAKG